MAYDDPIAELAARLRAGRIVAIDAFSYGAVSWALMVRHGITNHDALTHTFTRGEEVLDVTYLWLADLFPDLHALAREAGEMEKEVRNMGKLFEKLKAARKAQKER